MKLIIKNINKVQNAEIKLEGLTVIAGANGSGKSTVGKLLFSMIKSMVNANVLIHQSKERKLEKRVRELYVRANGCFARQNDQEVDTIFPLPFYRMVEQLQALADAESVDKYLDHLLSWIESKELSPRVKSLFAEDIDNIRIALGDSQAANVASEARIFIESEFMNRICSFESSNSQAELDINDPNDKLVLEFKGDKIIGVQTLYKEPLADATYVESPLYLHILDTLLAATTYREYQKKPRLLFRGMVPIHIKDLATKIYALQMAASSSDNSLEFGLSDIMRGQFVFNNDSKSLRFISNDNGLELSPINIASGIKTFGLIQILLETQVIGNNKVLIWDEPENHLHPRWQIAFAEILVKLAQKGIPVVVSTHSPYFVQGIKFYSAKHDLENYTNYYLAEEKENHLSEIKEVTNDLNQIFSKLAEPLNDIMNVDQVRRERNQK